MSGAPPAGFGRRTGCDPGRMGIHGLEPLPGGFSGETFVDRACLVHSDFNPKNLLVDPATGELTGLLDWEFAHAGNPVTDLGNLLRFNRDPVFVSAVLDGYLELAGHLGELGRRPRERLLDLARAADLVALADLAGRRGRTRWRTGPTGCSARSRVRGTCTRRRLR
jgi:aminoglycoside phosphotransferase (APT) family kinase protein